MVIETNEGSTPNGGMHSEIYYLSKERLPVSKEKAELAIVQELDKDGTLVSETIANLERKVKE